MIAYVIKALARRAWFWVAGYRRLTIYETATDDGNTTRHEQLRASGWEPRECIIIPLGMEPGVVGGQPRLMSRIVWAFRRECGEHWLKPAGLTPLPMLQRDAQADRAAAVN